jgi:hypothetical protein
MTKRSLSTWGKDLGTEKPLLGLPQEGKEKLSEVKLDLFQVSSSRHSEITSDYYLLSFL